jgi:N-carbamoyl-L-amino-acid hydrolase
VPTNNPARLLGDLRALAEIGKYKSGVHRPTLSADDLRARALVIGWMRDAGLDADTDGIGNILGRSRAKGRIMLAGSHLESQNHAGWLDGALGVIYALEAARALSEDPATAHLGVDVASWCDEEGHFGHFLGSRSAIGLVTEEEIDKATDRPDGRPLRRALAEAGLAGKPRFKLDPTRYAGYFEAHVEQGDTLDSSGLKIGVVTAIVGNWRYDITVEGEQNHAGTTRMAIRKDAAVGLIRLCNAIHERFPTVAGPRTVWTFGKITLDPGSANIVPGRADLVFHFREADPALLPVLEKALHDLVAEADAHGPCRFTISTVSQSKPALMDEGFQQALDRAGERHAPGKHLRLPSGAGHDAQYLARVMPAAMLFVPSIGGISHHWLENTKDEDIVLGAQVFTTAIADVLAG